MMVPLELAKIVSSGSSKDSSGYEGLIEHVKESERYKERHVSSVVVPLVTGQDH